MIGLCASHVWLDDYIARFTWTLLTLSLLPRRDEMQKNKMSDRSSQERCRFCRVEMKCRKTK